MSLYEDSVSGQRDREFVFNDSWGNQPWSRQVARLAGTSLCWTIISHELCGQIGRPESMSIVCLPLLVKVNDGWLQGGPLCTALGHCINVFKVCKEWIT